MNRAVRLVNLILILFIIFSVNLYPRTRHEIDIEKLKPEDIKKIKSFHVNLYKGKVTKRIELKLTGEKLTGNIKYYIPESVYNKILRTLCDYDKNGKINGFEKGNVIKVMNQTVVKNLNITINDSPINCVIYDENVKNVNSKVSNKPIDYSSKLKCEFKVPLKKNSKYKFFLTDFITVIKKQDRFASPVKVELSVPSRWEIKEYSQGKMIKKRGKVIFEDVKLDKDNSFSFSFFAK